MELDAIALARDHGPLEGVQLVANGTTITVAERPGRAIQILVYGADGGRIVDVTVWPGPSGVTDE